MWLVISTIFSKMKDSEGHIESRTV